MKKSRRRKSKRKPFKFLRCSPHIRKTQKRSMRVKTCLTDAHLDVLKDLWNAKHPDQRIRSKDHAIIWETLKRNYEDTCDKETCWIRTMSKGTKWERELLSNYAPYAPQSWKKKPNEWLSSVDIYKVMNQYMHTYPEFQFIGPSPIDWKVKIHNMCVWEELCKFDLAKTDKRKFGIVFNTDPHYLGGSHWISLWIDVDAHIIFFFDSVGTAAPQGVMDFVKVVQNQSRKKYGSAFMFDSNIDMEHQKSNTECGMYSLYCLIGLLEGTLTCEKLKTERIPDSVVFNQRKMLFN